MFVYVDDVDETLAGLRDGDVRVLKEPEDMFWGERVAWIADPDGTLSPLPPPDQPKPPSPEQVPEQLRTSSR